MARTVQGSPQLRRSVLYVPADRPGALRKIADLDADAFILDLEDAVAPEAKPEARELAVDALDAPLVDGRERVLRINGLETPWGDDDLAAAAATGADAVLLPKVEAVGEIAEAAQRLRKLGREDLPLWVMIETPRGVLAVSEIAAVDEDLRVLVMGTSDLTRDLAARHTPGREPLATSLGLSLLAARAHGLAILDGVHLDLDDAAGFRRACEQAADLGFDGKTLIHPRTISAANEAFAPTPEQLADARRIVEAHTEAQRAGRGIAVVDGRLVEALHVAQARALLARAARIADLER